MKTLGVLLWVFVTVILKAPYSLAEPPGTVWRMDTRPEHLIFHAGFQAWGSNFNVHDHVTGESCVNRQQGQRDSGFVSTAANFQFIRTAAAARAFAQPGQRIYLYRVRPDSNFFNAEASLRTLHDNNPQVPITPLNYHPSRAANEYITPTLIPTQNIRDVESYIVVDGELQVSTAQVNPRYVADNTRATNRPYFNGEAPRERRPTWLGMIPMVGACLAASRSDLKQDIPAIMFTLESVYNSSTSIINHDEL